MNDVLVCVTLETVTCCECGIPFGIPDYHNKRLQENGGHFWCPSGHPQHYSKSEVQKLKEQLNETKRKEELFRNWYRAEQDDHERTRRSLSATKGVLTKTKKRIANGVCPCCNRHFVNLQRHIDTKHPSYSNEEVMPSE